MTIDLSRFRDTYFEEAGEHMMRLEEGLLQLEREGSDPELLNTIFRSVHSIKGSGGTFGFTDVVDFAHRFESVLDRLREGALDPDPGLIALLLEATDCLKGLLEAAEHDDVPAPEVEDILGRLGGYMDRPDAKAEPTDDDEPKADADPVTYRIRIVPMPELMRTGMDPFLLLRDLEDLGTLEDVTPDLSKLPALSDLDPERCYLSWSLRLRTAAAVGEIREIFAFVEDSCTVEIEKERSGTPEATAAPSEAPRSSAPKPSRPATSRAATTIRVSTDKVDELINLVGELIISRSIVRQVLDSAGEAMDPLLSDAVDTMERNIRDLQDRVLSVRMVPVEMLFSRFPRLIHDLGASSGKDIELVLSGEDTELDKGVIERMVDPLTHLLRNAVDHGIEPPDVRAEGGKPATATIHLSARAEAGAVILDVSDDGGGLDRARIREKAEAQGLVRPDEEITDEQLCALIFEAGFSTAAAVSDISGRGVGMDVVRRNVEALNGTVTVVSTPRRGTRFTIKLPLTLAILEGMQLRVGEQVFVLPLLAILESFRPTTDAIQTVVGRGEVVTVHGQTVPLVRLSRILDCGDDTEEPGSGLVILIEHEGRRVALLADDLLDQTQIVVKNLEANYQRVEGIMGATILGDGRVALILDVGGLVRLALDTRSTSSRVEAATALRSEQKGAFV